MQFLIHMKIVKYILTLHLLRFLCVISNNFSETKFPRNWPSEWNDSTIPYAFNFFSPSIGYRRPPRKVSSSQHLVLTPNSTVQMILCSGLKSAIASEISGIIGLNILSWSGPKRLISLVQKGHSYMEERSCLTFKEYDPRQLSKSNLTYLYYSYSGVLENCCLPFFQKRCGRRLVLITPLCTLPGEVAHTTMHAMGLYHRKNQPFLRNELKNILFNKNCEDKDYKMKIFESRMINIYDKK